MPPRIQAIDHHHADAHHGDEHHGDGHHGHHAPTGSPWLVPFVWCGVALIGGVVWHYAGWENISLASVLEQARPSGTLEVGTGAEHANGLAERTRQSRPRHQDACHADCVFDGGRRHPVGDRLLLLAES